MYIAEALLCDSVRTPTIHCIRTIAKIAIVGGSINMMILRRYIDTMFDTVRWPLPRALSDNYRLPQNEVFSSGEMYETICVE